MGHFSGIGSGSRGRQWKGARLDRQAGLLGKGSWETLGGGGWWLALRPWSGRGLGLPAGFVTCGLCGLGHIAHPLSVAVAEPRSWPSQRAP